MKMVKSFPLLVSCSFPHTYIPFHVFLKISFHSLCVACDKNKYGMTQTKNPNLNQLAAIICWRYTLPVQNSLPSPGQSRWMWCGVTLLPVSALPTYKWS